MAVREILLLGNPRLYRRSEPVKEEDLPEVEEIVQDLHDTLWDYRRRYGAGRAIAAPQIGVEKRIIYICIDEPLVLLNPYFTEKSTAMMEVWDDCMSFPDLLVRVRRHKTCRINFRDEGWRERSLFLEDDWSELLQHEYDHLEGILAVARALDGQSFALRSQRWYL